MNGFRDCGYSRRVPNREIIKRLDRNLRQCLDFSTVMSRVLESELVVACFVLFQVEDSSKDARPL